ncbi:MAG: glycerophosphodiester phosphodiesterase [Chitinispirillaceae bacterium]|nr:glycerophosphodiester phosphodiesterase [Chitinispirillaceae bacterium]
MITIVAHRGAPRRARENTVKSFLAAVSMGADMVELDVRKTGDGTLVVFHDPWLSRKTRRPLIAGLTCRELNRRAGKRKFRVPTVEEAFEALAGKTMLNIELKEPGYEADVVKLAKRIVKDGRYILTSFNPAIITALKSFNAGLTTGLIVAKSRDLPAALKTEAEVLAPEKDLFAAQRDFFAEANGRGRKIAVWTVDSVSRLSSLIVDPLVDAVITNRPDLAVALRKKLCGG